MEPQSPAIQSTPASATKQVFAVVFATLAGVQWVFVALVLLVIVPKFEDIFTDFGVALPYLAQGFITLSRAWWLVLLLACAAIMLTAFAGFKTKPALAIVSFVAALLAMAMTVFSVLLPLVTMIESLGE